MHTYEEQIIKTLQHHVSEYRKAVGRGQMYGNESFHAFMINAMSAALRHHPNAELKRRAYAVLNQGDKK